MRKIVFSLLALGVMLAGCASAEAEQPSTSPTPTPEVNAVACSSFEQEFHEGVDPMPEYLSDWEATRDAVDEIGLTAEGDVKERLQKLVTHWPELGDVFVWYDLDNANQMLGDIERACAASGQEISVQLVAVD